MLFAISLGPSLLILLVPQWIMTYFRWLGTGKRSTQQRICCVCSPPIMRFTNSLKNIFQALLLRETPVAIESQWHYNAIIMVSKQENINWCTWFLWTFSQCIFWKGFVGTADKDFPRACFINNLSSIANSNNLSSWINNIKLSLSIAKSE